jgi:hypothetical protein
MGTGQRRRLEKLVSDYKRHGIFTPEQISAGAHDLARHLPNPPEISRDNLNDFLRRENLPEISQQVWDSFTP